jgi:tRNA pseudouridine55 synthase
LGRKRSFGRKVSGVLLVNKPSGESSNAVLQRAKRLFFANKAGHTGALDPLATGVLPVCFGEATKFSQYLLESDKVYISDFQFGVVTDSADADGEVLSKQDASHISKDDVLAALPEFRGDIEQIPPMYSALKKDGQPLYKLARKGIEVERDARPVSIYEYRLLDFQEGEHPVATMRIHCSKGTYVRSLAADLGEKLGVGANVIKLHREQVGPFKDDTAFTLEALDEERGDGRAEQLDHHLLSTDATLVGLAKIQLTEDCAYYFRQGNPVMDLEVYQIGEEGDTVRVFDESEHFLGTAEITDDGRLAPKRLVVF